MTGVDRLSAKAWTDLAAAPVSRPHPDAAEAVRAAERVASRRGLHIREVSGLTDLATVNRLFDSIWRPTGSAPVTLELLRAFGKAGNYVAAAFDGTTMVGACVGFFAAPSDDLLYSHIAGVSPAVAGRDVGFALKLHQRAWALLRGVQAISWTFDPLVSRNAYFNLAKLAAVPAEYLTNFYGPMRDEINGDGETDRLLVHWDLTADHVALAGAGTRRSLDVAADHRYRDAVVALGRDDAGDPVPGRRGAGTLLVATPPDIERLRVTRPAVAERWRRMLRDTLGGLMNDGGRVAGFDRAGWYLVHHEGGTS